MIYIIAGPRQEKLSDYDILWIKLAIYDILERDLDKITLAYSRMASSVDLWFCEICLELEIPYMACVPFQDPTKTIQDKDQGNRVFLISKAKGVKTSRNSLAVEKSDVAVIVWDGYEGDTHSVLKQFISYKKSFYWINPVKQVVLKCP